MNDEDRASEAQDAGATALARLRGQILARWRAFPREREHELDALLGAALERAEQAEPEVLTVMNPVSRPQRLRLAALVSDADLDSFYHNEWAELAVSSAGRCYLVYRRRDGGDYAVEWSSATSVPESVLGALPEVLAIAMFDDDGGADG